MIALRVGRGLLVILLVTFVARVMLSLASGSIAEGLLGSEATPENVAALEARLGLDRPIWEQYLTWLVGAVQGDLGTSMFTQQPVAESIIARIPVSFQLAAMGILIAVVVATIFAILSASFPDSPLDRALNALSSVLLSAPGFVAGPIFIFVFAIVLGWLPVLGWVPLSENPIENLKFAILPALAIAVQEIAALHRLLRTDLITTLGDDFILAARARGMGRAYVMFRHAFRPSSFSLITVLAINIGNLLGGAVIVEVLFSLPGVGGLLVTSITTRDIPMVLGVVTFIAIIYVIMNLVVDLLYGVLDPRVRRPVAR